MSAALLCAKECQFVRCSVPLHCAAAQVDLQRGEDGEPMLVFELDRGWVDGAPHVSYDPLVRRPMHQPLAARRLSRPRSLSRRSVSSDVISAPRGY
jgi:hypothetical protein